MEEISQTPSNDRYDSPLVYSREDSPSVREGSQREITEERRAKLREIEVSIPSCCKEKELVPLNMKGCSNNYSFGYERVYLPIYKVADTPFHTKIRHLHTYKK